MQHVVVQEIMYGCVCESVFCFYVSERDTCDTDAGITKRS